MLPPMSEPTPTTEPAAPNKLPSPPEVDREDEHQVEASQRHHVRRRKRPTQDHKTGGSRTTDLTRPNLNFHPVSSSGRTGS